MIIEFFFGDPLYGVKKTIFIKLNGINYTYDDNYIVNINIKNNTVTHLSIENLDKKLTFFIQN